ncbi:hypothetical protein [Ruthenibacterium lactatiformans]|uniref:hypothetical protein n=1 Tax=Ruthenibacterium lactatiformans TaxID=1550024 RepID=UPI0019689CF5|nr:hypothetical protein [Ruthenibacterium lactatiformans]MBN3012967.1 hypothetical protein [Ruthenibacterium lactatiformans]
MSDKLLMLKADYKRLAAEKDGLYAEYGKLKKQLREYDTVKQNIDSILHATQGARIGKSVVVPGDNHTLFAI